MTVNDDAISSFVAKAHRFAYRTQPHKFVFKHGNSKQGVVQKLDRTFAPGRLVRISSLDWKKFAGWKNDKGCLYNHISYDLTPLKMLMIKERALE